MPPVPLSVTLPCKQGPKWASAKERERVGVGGMAGGTEGTAHPRGENRGLCPALAT